MKSINIIIIFLCVLCTGCNKFLDVTPENKVFEDELFQNRDGFENALADVYYRMSLPGLYGRELKFGTLDVMAGYWNVPAQQHLYSPIMPINFQVPLYQSTLGVFWSELYGSVNRVNHILKNIEQIKDDTFYNLVRGEALGLRAFLHLEILRLFGPSIAAEGLGSRGIPYYKEIKNKPQPFLTTQQVLDLIEEDLIAAEEALEDDPIVDLGRTGNANGYGTLKYNSLIDRRGNRMNYFAVLAIKARKSMWEGKLEEAYARAELLMKDLPEEMRLVNSADIASNLRRNRRFTSENIFSLYVANHREMTLSYLPPLATVNVNASPTLLPQYTNLVNTLFNNPADGSINDYRLLNWFAATTSGQNRFVRFEINTDEQDNPNQYEVSLVSLAEMYLIMAEAKAAVAPEQALEILNKLRLSRNLTSALNYDPVSMTTENIMTFIINESKKSFMGEGYTYLMYKRMFRPIVRPTGTIAPTQQLFRFPVPIDEGTYNSTK